MDSFVYSHAHIYIYVYIDGHEKAMDTTIDDKIPSKSHKCTTGVWPGLWATAPYNGCRGSFISVAPAVTALCNGLHNMCSLELSVYRHMLGEVILLTNKRKLPLFQGIAHTLLRLLHQLIVSLHLTELKLYAL